MQQKQVVEVLSCFSLSFHKHQAKSVGRFLQWANKAEQRVVHRKALLLQPPLARGTTVIVIVVAVAVVVGAAISIGSSNSLLIQTKVSI